MTALLRMLSCEGWMNLGVALLHTLWQAALLAGGLYLLLRVLPARRANLGPTCGTRPLWRPCWACWRAG